ncbi:uncharacterized protein LOC130655374 [Hydractinia symbiolongicarpus]|uniref:uncharacterized protein LOC130655374 n=1 Tax=Hydractinia symbiolongicarpus TaxID=13093 RepID=UPI00254E277D|nr:uncharacterized protein LOC130655374 [Hydractinia symbiolongicarpus]
MVNATALVPELDIWQNSGMIVPAIMTLICFICTAVSLTVSGFICLRDREAQDDSTNKAKHHKEQEFISKVLGLFYKIRTSNIFRIKEIMQDLNDERPVWIGTKNEIITNLEYYGIFLTETEKSKLMTNEEVFEIDCESLFYFELERFSKAQAIYGSNVLRYFACIQQDGSAFPREFYPEIKSIFHIDIIYNVFTEMQIISDLFVLLATGIDLEIISVTSMPPQFRHSQLGNELEKIKEFLYNYFKRVFPTERSTANVMRKLPQLPMVYEQIMGDMQPETIETVVDVEEEETYYKTVRRKAPVESTPRYTMESKPVETRPLKADSPPISLGARRVSSGESAGARGRRLSGSLGKQKVKMVRVYQRLTDRVKQKQSVVTEDIVPDPEEAQQTTSFESEEQAGTSKEVKFEPQPSPPMIETVEPATRTIKRQVTKRVPVVRQPEETQEYILDQMRTRYKAPIKRESNARRRGRLYKEVVIQHNAFTYMISRVLGFLQDRGHLSDKELDNEKYMEIDRNFII